MIAKFNHESEGGLSDYSRILIDDIKETLDNYFSAPDRSEKELSEPEIACEVINKRFIRTCLMSIFADMSPDERKEFKDQPLDIVYLIRTAMDRLNLSEDDKKAVENVLEKITPEDARLPSRMIKRLGLLNHESQLYKTEEALYKSLQEKTEAAEAYSYLNLTS